MRVCSKKTAFIFLMFPALFWAQIKTSLSPGSTSVEVDTTQLQKENKLPANTLEAFFKENEKYSLQDYQNAKTLDSLWLSELYGSGLFDTIYKEVTTLDVKERVAPAVPTDTLKARLHRLNQKTPFNIAYNPSLESVINSFLKNRSKTMEKIMALSEFYFPLFEKELDAYDIPLEMKYLAIVESALNPRAKSRVGASGLWQFMYTTGKMYKLDVSSYVDERYDPIRATKAACEYLGKLYELFGDWDLALAAYNSGPGNVNKAIRRSGGYENYWNIRRFLPRETAGYVPAFLATMYIFEYAEEHGFKPEHIKNPYFQTDTIHVKHLITFDQISELVGLEVEAIRLLNPSYKLDIIPFDKDKNYALRLPVNELGKFVSNEEAIYAHVKEELSKREKPLPQLVKDNERVRYRVRSGDYLGRIAERYGVRVSDIKRWNGLRNNTLQIGQRLTIYPRKPGVRVSKSPTKTQVVASTKGDKKTYVVKDGDSLWLISKKFPGISVENLQEWNGISGKNLKPGMTLKLYSS